MNPETLIELRGIDLALALVPHPPESFPLDPDPRCSKCRYDRNPCLYCTLVRRRREIHQEIRCQASMS